MNKKLMLLMAIIPLLYVGNAYAANPSSDVARGERYRGNMEGHHNYENRGGYENRGASQYHPAANSYDRGLETGAAVGGAASGAGNGAVEVMPETQYVVPPTQYPPPPQ